MTLPGTLLFPHALLPLFIFEPRYREMLNDVLEGDRVFAIAAQDVASAEKNGEFEPPFQIGVAGIIRASHENEDGTSNLILQGLIRVRLDEILTEKPYRLARITPLETTPGADDETLGNERDKVQHELKRFQKLGGEVPCDALRFLESLEDPDAYLDIAIFTLCDDSQAKQQMLGTLNTYLRFRSFIDYLVAQNDRLHIERQLQGALSDTDISCN